MKTIATILLAVTLLTSCHKEESPKVQCSDVLAVLEEVYVDIKQLDFNYEHGHIDYEFYHEQYVELTYKKNRLENQLNDCE